MSSITNIINTLLDLTASIEQDDNNDDNSTAMGSNYNRSWSDPESESDEESSPIDKHEKDPGSSDKEADNKQLQKVHNPPPPEQNTPSTSGLAPKEPTPGQVVDLPASGKLEDAKFEDTKKEDTTPPDDGFRSKHDHGTGKYGFGSGPPVSEQEGGRYEQPYKPADMGRIDYGKAPGPPAGRVEELDDDGGAPGGSGGWGAPGGPGGSGGGSGGGNGPVTL